MASNINHCQPAWLAAVAGWLAKNDKSAHQVNSWRARSCGEISSHDGAERQAEGCGRIHGRLLSANGPKLSVGSFLSAGLQC